MRTPSLCPSSYRPGDENIPGSPYYKEPSATEVATQAIDDAEYFVKNSALFLSAGKKDKALAEVRDALVAIQSAIDALEEA